MSGPKPFQIRTIDHVVSHLWEAADTTRRFLVADEVGLGKTIVARGVIHEMLDRFRAAGRRVDVLYICSNAAIAAQNLDKLVGSHDQGRAFASRLTLLPLQRDHWDERGVNFISFTPATAFDLKGRGGLAKERALLHHYLEAKFRNLDGLSAALSLGVGVESWAATLADVRKTKPDAKIGWEFRAAVTADASLVAMIKRVAGLSVGRDAADTETHRIQIELASRLRRLLAKTCLRLVAPQALVVLDEFQRFVQLLKEPEEGDAADGPGEWEADRERQQRRGDWFGGWDKPAIPEWDHVPSGTLVFELDRGGGWDGLRRRFADSKRKHVEDMIDDVFGGALGEGSLT